MGGCAGYYTYHGGIGAVGWGRVMGCGGLSFFHDKDGGERGRTGGGGGEVGAECPLLGGWFHRFDGT